MLAVLTGVVASCPADIVGQYSHSPTHLQISTSCIFSVRASIFESVSGTALYMNQKDSSAMVSDCTFMDCLNTVNRWSFPNRNTYVGGACCFRVKNSTIMRSCGYNCTAVAGHFGSFDANYGVHRIAHCALYACGNQMKANSDSQDALDLANGVQEVELVNFSWCESGRDGAAFETRWATALKIFACNVMSCEGVGIITLMMTDSTVSGVHDTTMVNLFNNTAKSTSSFSLVTFLGNYTLKQWNFLANSGYAVTRILEYQTWYPIAWAMNTKLISCVSDVEMTGTHFLLTDHVVLRDAQTIALDHLQTFMCVMPTLGFNQQGYSCCVNERVLYSCVSIFLYIFM